MTGWLFGAAACCLLLATAGSGQAAPPVPERKHIGDAAADSVKLERQNTLDTNARVSKAYTEEDDTSSNLWNMRRWKQAVKKSEDPVLSDHLRRWMYSHHIPAKYLDPDVAPTAYVPFSRGIYMDPIPGVGSGSISGASGITEFNPEQAMDEHKRLLHEFSSSPFNYIMWLRRALASNPSTAAVANAVGAGAEVLDPYHFQTTQYLPQGWGLAAQGLRNKVALATTTALASGIPTPESYRTFDQQIAPFSQMDPFSAKLTSIYPWSPTLMESGGAPNQPQPMAEDGGNSVVSFLQAASGAHPFNNHHNRRPAGVDSAMGLAHAAARTRASADANAHARAMHLQAKEHARHKDAELAGAEQMRFASARHRARHGRAQQQHLSASAGEDGPTGVDSMLPGHPNVRLHPFQTGLLPSSFSRPMEGLATGPFSFMTPPASITSDPRTNTAFGGWSAFDPATHAPMGVPIYPPNPNNPLVAGGAPPRADAIGSPPVSVYRGDVVAAMQDVSASSKKSSKSKSTKGKTADTPPPQLLMPQMYPQLYAEREHLMQQGSFNAASQQRGAQGTGGIYPATDQHDEEEDGEDGDSGHSQSSVGVGPPMSGGLVPAGGSLPIPGPLTSSDTAPSGMHLAPMHPGGGYLSASFFTGLDHPNSAGRASLNGHRASYRDLHKAMVGKEATEEDVRRFAPEEASYDDGFAGRITGQERAAGVTREDQVRPTLTGPGYHHGNRMRPAMAGADGHPGMNGYGTGATGHGPRFDRHGNQIDNTQPAKDDQAYGSGESGADDDDGGGSSDSGDEGGSADHGHDSHSELRDSLETLNAAVHAIAATQKSLAREVESRGCGCTGCACSQDGEGDGDADEDSEDQTDEDGGANEDGEDQTDEDGGANEDGEDGTDDNGDANESDQKGDEDQAEEDVEMRFLETRGSSTAGWHDHHSLHRAQRVPARFDNSHHNHGRGSGSYGRGGHSSFEDQAEFDADAHEGHLRNQHGSLHQRVAAGIDSSRWHVHNAVHNHLHKYLGDSSNDGDDNDESSGSGSRSYDEPEPVNQLMPKVQSHLPRLPGKVALDGDVDSDTEEVADMAQDAQGDTGRHDSYSGHHHQGATVGEDHHSWDSEKHGRELSRTLPDAAGEHEWEDSDLPSPAAPRLQSDPADMLVLDPTVDTLSDDEKAEKMKLMIKARHSSTQFRFRGSAKAKAQEAAQEQAHKHRTAPKPHREPAAEPRFAQTMSRAQARHAVLARHGASIANPVFDDERVARSLAEATGEALAESPFAMRGDDVVARHERGAAPSEHSVLPQQHLLEIRQRISGRADGDNDGSHANDALKANLVRFLSRRQKQQSGTATTSIGGSSAQDDESAILRSIREAALHKLNAPPDLFLQTTASFGHARSAAAAGARAGSAQAALGPESGSPSPSPSIAARNKAAIMAVKAKNARAHASAAPSQSPKPSPTPSPNVTPMPATAEREADAEVGRFAEAGAAAGAEAGADADAEAAVGSYGVQAARDRITMGAGTDADLEKVRKADDEAVVSTSLKREGDPIYSSKKAKKPAMTTPAPTSPPKLQKLELASLKDMRDTKDFAAALLHAETPHMPAPEPKKLGHFNKHVFAPAKPAEGQEPSPDLVRNLAHGVKELFSEDMEEDVSPQAPPPDPLPMMEAKTVMEEAQGDGERRVSDPAPSADYSLPMPEDDPWHPKSSTALKRVIRDMQGIAVGGLSEPIEQLMGPGAGNARKFFNMRDMMNGPFGDTSSVIGEEYNKRVLHKLLAEQEEEEE